MKKQILILLLLFSSFSLYSQSRGIRIGYIDMEYILENVPDYKETKNQLELKAQRWKQEIETKKNEIKALKESLNTEKVLLTKELIEEREEEITFLETELMEYQQKRFGPLGDLVTQKAVLVKPIQDQVFTAIQDIAERQKYDFVFDKSSDLTMLFAQKRHDISDQVIRAITRASKREQMTRKELKALDEKERMEDMIDENPGLAERQRVLDERKAARDSIQDARRLAAEAKRKEFEDRRAKMLEEKEAKKNGTVSAKETTTGENSQKTTPTEDAKTKAQTDREKIIEDRKKELEERRQKILEQREAAKKEREEKLKPKTQEENPSTEEATPSTEIENENED